MVVSRWGSRQLRAVLVFSLACGLLLVGALSAGAASNPYAKKIVFVRSGDLWTCDSNGSHAKKITVGSTAMDSGPRWSADHRSIYFIRTQNNVSSIRRVSAGGGTTTKIDVRDLQYDGAYRVFSAVGPSRDGKYLFVGETVELAEFTTVARILRYDIVAGTAEFVAEDEPLDFNHNYGHIDPSADGVRLVVVRFEGDTSSLHCFDTEAATWKILSPSGISGRVGPSDEVLMSNWPDRKSTALKRITMSATTVKTLKSIKGLTPANQMPYEAFGYSPGGTMVLYGRNGALYTATKSGGSAKRIAKNSWTADW